ncbi:MAG: AI-2E family transporter [Planctomycetes bacterium]|nr:AI-2E family transporter [Planctomycetota bacterium]
MIETLSPGRRNLALALLAALLLWGAWAVRAALNPLIAGYFLAFVLHPLVLRLQRRGWSRARAVHTIFGGAFLAATALTLMVAVQTVQGVRALVDPVVREAQLAKFEAFLERHGETVETVLELLGAEAEPEASSGAAPPASDAPEEPVRDASDAARRGASAGGERPQGAARGEPAAAAEGGPDARKRTHQLIVAVRDATREFSESIDTSAGADAAARAGVWIGHAFGSLFGLLTFVLLLPVYAYFLLFELERIHAYVARYVPWRHRERITRVAGEIGRVLSSFFRGRLVVCVLKGLVLAVLLWLCGVRYALLLGLGAGFASLLPFVGPFAAFVAAYLVAVTQADVGVLAALLRTGPAFFAAELVEGYVLVPKVLGESLGLHEVVVLLAIFVGGAAFGAFGVLVALPVTATAVILFREFVQPSLARFADEDEALLD